MLIMDPEMVEDLYTKKNALTDKTGEMEDVFKNLLGNSFLFSKGGPIWKAKR